MNTQLKCGSLLEDFHRKNGIDLHKFCDAVSCAAQAIELDSPGDKVALARVIPILPQRQGNPPGKPTQKIRRGAIIVVRQSGIGISESRARIEITRYSLQQFLATALVHCAAENFFQARLLAQIRPFRLMILVQSAQDALKSNEQTSQRVWFPACAIPGILKDSGQVAKQPAGLSVAWIHFSRINGHYSS